LICTDYVEEIFQTFLNVTKDDLKKAAKQLKENTPPAMNMMLNKQSKAEAVKKRDERKKIVVKNVPPTTPGI
jgi:predicted Zn-dependent peptidase